MLEKDTDGLPLDREHYKELARQVREVARLARFPFARRQLLRLAASFEYLARPRRYVEDFGNMRMTRKRLDMLLEIHGHLGQHFARVAFRPEELEQKDDAQG